MERFCACAGMHDAGGDVVPMRRKHANNVLAHAPLAGRLIIRTVKLFLASLAAKRCLVNTNKKSPSLRAGVAGRVLRSKGHKAVPPHG